MGADRRKAVGKQPPSVADTNRAGHADAISENDEDRYEPGERWGDLARNSWRPTIAQRVAAGLFLLVFAFLEANLQFEWGFLGGWGKAAEVISVVVGLVMFYRFVPAFSRKLK